MNSGKRTKSIKIRVTEDELSALNALKSQAGFSMLAEYMRSISLNFDVSAKQEYPKIDPALLRQVSGIGNNINQIARQVNASNLKPSDAAQIISYLSSIDRTLITIRDDWSISNAS